MLSYWELRDQISRVVPRRSQLAELERMAGLVKEKGRKSNYTQLHLKTGEMVRLERLLNKEQITSFLEVSLRAAHCPMPLNADVYDALRCPFRCQYCFADSFRASLYTSFFDNSKTLGMRICKPDYFRAELDKLMKFRGERNNGNEVQRAIGLEIPIRLGIRFEDFPPMERRLGVSLDFMKALAEIEYPIMINTKSDLIGEEDYVRVLAENKGKSAVHITMISSDDALLKRLEPGAPQFGKRVAAAKNLTDAGVRVVARIEPFMVFVTDERPAVEAWVKAIKDAGVTNITLDTYSWSAAAPGIQRQMEVQGFDFARMFELMSESQWLGSILLGKFMDYLREQGFTCSTFDFGNTPKNDQSICCEVGDWFTGFSFGNTIMAIRFITQSEGWVSWDMYEELVEEAGGWLSDSLRTDVFNSWNLLGNPAYFPDWAQGIESCGVDRYGRKVWKYHKDHDFRENMLKGLLEEI